MLDSLFGGEAQGVASPINPLGDLKLNELLDLLVVLTREDHEDDGILDQAHDQAKRGDIPPFPKE